MQRSVLALITTSLFFCQIVLAQDAHHSKGAVYDTPSVLPSSTRAAVPCENGFAESYPCKDIDLMSFLTIQDLLGGLPIFTTGTNDIWGWTDPETGREYALVGLRSGVSIVDVTDPEIPQVIGVLVGKTGSSTWRDIKVYRNHAFIVADAAANHGMQIYDLTQLRDIENPPQRLEETAHYDRFGSAHNIVINEETGYAYAVGANVSGETCGGGLHMIDIRNPTEPVFQGCYADVSTGTARTGYTHDAQCVVYRGPDVDYQGREICVGANETALSIADVTDKSNPIRITSVDYPNVSYSHQGWFSRDHQYFFLDDETDEIFGLPTTRTIIWDMADLDDPIVANEYFAQTPTTDHNQYVVGQALYQSNYSSGLRILDIRDPLSPKEVGYFDVIPDTSVTTGTDFGTWSNYPFFESGIVVVTSIRDGLFVLKPTGTALAVATENELPLRSALSDPYPNPFKETTTFTLNLDASDEVRVEVFDVLGRRVDVLFEGNVPSGSPISIDFSRGTLPAGTYFIRTEGRSVSQTKTVNIIR